MRSEISNAGEFTHFLFAPKERGREGGEMDIGPQEISSNFPSRIGASCGAEGAHDECKTLEGYEGRVEEGSRGGFIISSSTPSHLKRHPKPLSQAAQIFNPVLSSYPPPLSLDPPHHTVQALCCCLSQTEVHMPCYALVEKK